VRQSRAGLIALHSGSEGVEVGNVHDNRNVAHAQQLAVQLGLTSPD
jgi:hypothetical protein